ncbi:hypothetical protein V8C35DRAFT_276538 [Trichoderma chlorosporum]
MSPHVLLRVEKQKEENLQSSLLFCVICLAFFAAISALVSYLERYKRRLVKFLLLPFAALQDEDQGDGEQLFRHPTQPHPNHFDHYHQFQYGHYNHHDRPLGMSASKSAMETDRDVLYHAQVTLGCNGLRDLYNLGFMRQDTLERRIKAAGKRISLNSTVSLCAVWLREKIGRTFSTTGMVPSIKHLCLFLERRGCSRDMCCQIFYDAFQKVDPDHASQVSLRVGKVVLTSFRAVVDHIHDHWYQWLDEPETPTDVVVSEPAEQRNDDGKMPYPAYNHDLAMLSPAEFSLRLAANLEQLHKGHDHHSRRDNDDARRGAQRRQHPGYCAPFDLGQASSWGSDPNQSDRCATRQQDCVYYPEQDKKRTRSHDKMVTNPQRAALLAKTCATASADDSSSSKTAQQTQVLLNTETDKESTSDLIIFSSSPRADQVEAARVNDDAARYADRDGRRRNEHVDAESAISSDLISFKNNFGGMEEVDHFLADVDIYSEGEVQDTGIALQAEDETRKKQKLDGASVMELCLLDSAPEMDDGPGSGPESMMDIHLGVGSKPIRRDTSYCPIIQDLFYDRDNLWIQKGNRPTALEMWDVAASTSLGDDNQLWYVA